VNALPMRIAAFGIAALAVVDPAITASRASRAIVSVVTPDSAASFALANRVAEVLDRRFTVVRDVFDAAAATVVVGHALPDDASELNAPLLFVAPSEAARSIRIVDVNVPQRSPLNARSPIRVKTLVRGANGDTLVVQLTHDGAVIEQLRGPILIDSGNIESIIDYLPPTNRDHVIGAFARIAGTSAVDSAFAVVDIRVDRLPVLYYDALPSWASTFVRRAVEEDPRFSVTHRAVTSRGVSNTAGSAPPSLSDAESLSRFAAIVVGSPENLSAADVIALEAYMRRRGGRVVVLATGRGAGALDRLAGVSSWRSTRVTAPSTIGELRGRDFVWPSVVPRDATIHLAQLTRDSSRRPIVWSVPVGAGRLLLSGALDAWEHRGDSSGFNEFWARTLAELSADAPDAMSLELSRRVLRPGETTQARISIREAVLSNSAARDVETGAALLGDSDSTVVRLWPDPVPGFFNATIVSPRTPGTYRLIAWTGEHRVESTVVVDAATRTTRHDDREVIEGFVSSRGGTVVDERDLRELPDRLASAIQVVSRVETWHPMRSPWWIVPFALLLGAEWWWRRRQGFA
jgi:hypothetical protein